MAPSLAACGLPPARAYHPVPLRVANRVLPPVWALHLLPPPDLERDTLVRMATRQARRTDFGPDDFWPQLDRLLASLRGEADLNAFGRMIAHGSILKVLKERLWAQDLFHRHPEILEQPLAPPVVVVGPMRSGTTRLHRLLAADARFAHLRLYEAMCPVPWPTSFRHPEPGRDPRARYVRQGLAFLHWVNPQIAAVHPTGPLEPDEELGLLEQSFAGAQIEAQRRVPGFARHCEAVPQDLAYAHMARLLQLTAWFRGQDPAKPWLLKTPQHMQDLASLDRLFPRARLIFTHRDPVRVVASAASLAWNQMVVQSDRVDPLWVGAEWLHKTAHRIEVAERVRPTIDPARQLDVRYAELEADWRAVMRRVYRFLDLELTPEVERRMAAYLARAEREQPHRRHRYRLADFGLEEAPIRARLAAYVERYGIPPEPARPERAPAAASA